LREAYRQVLSDQPAGSATRFVGREEELAALLARLPEPSEPAAVIAVTGLAGVGKTIPGFAHKSSCMVAT
jgi:hypothetical protein